MIRRALLLLITVGLVACPHQATDDAPPAEPPEVLSEPESPLPPTPEEPVEPPEPADPCHALQDTADEDSLLPHFVDFLEEQVPDFRGSEPHRLQILISEITTDPDCRVIHAHRVDEEYIYPASALKTTASIGALHHLAASEEPQWTLDTPLLVGDHSPRSLREYIELTQVISSNPGFNALFEITGFDEIHELFWDHGFTSLRIRHRMFSRLPLEAERYTPTIGVADPGDPQADPEAEPALLFDERRGQVDLPPHSTPNTEVGASHIDIWTRELRDEPLDFDLRNGFSLSDHHELMVALFAPDHTERTLPSMGPHEDFLRHTLEMDPVAYVEEHALNIGDHIERRFRPLMPGLLQHLDRADLRYLGKGGRAYGFHMENALLIHEPLGRTLFVTAVIYVNENEVLNDNHYEYDQVGFPFFEALGGFLGRELLDGAGE